MKETTRRSLLKLAVAAALALGFACAHAQVFPTRPITLVVPYTPGGTTDNIVRVIQAKLQEQLGQPIIVDNRPGASGNVGNRFVARATPERPFSCAFLP